MNCRRYFVIVSEQHGPLSCRRVCVRVFSFSVFVGQANKTVFDLLDWKGRAACDGKFTEEERCYDRTCEGDEFRSVFLHVLSDTKHAFALRLCSGTFLFEAQFKTCD